MEFDYAACEEWGKELTDSYLMDHFYLATLCNWFWENDLRWNLWGEQGGAWEEGQKVDVTETEICEV